MVQLRGFRPAIRVHVCLPRYLVLGRSELPGRLQLRKHLHASVQLHGIRKHCQLHMPPLDKRHGLQHERGAKRDCEGCNSQQQHSPRRGVPVAGELHLRQHDELKRGKDDNDRHNPSCIELHPCPGKQLLPDPQLDRDKHLDQRNQLRHIRIQLERLDQCDVQYHRVRQREHHRHGPKPLVLHQQDRSGRRNLHLLRPGQRLRRKPELDIRGRKPLQLDPAEVPEDRHHEPSREHNLPCKRAVLQHENDNHKRHND